MGVTLVTPKTTKQAQVLASARRLFWKHGFRRVSVEEVCRHADVSKMTFYRFWPNKIELAKAVFNQEVQEGIEKFRQILSGTGSPAEKVHKILVLKMEGARNISREFLQDFYANESLGLKTYVEATTARAWREILVDFRKAQEEGIFRKEVNPEFLLMIAQTMGAVLSEDRSVQLYDSPQELVKAYTDLIAYGIVSGHERPRPNNNP